MPSKLFFNYRYFYDNNKFANIIIYSQMSQYNLDHF